MSKIYKWYRNGRLYGESEDPEGKKMYKQYISDNCYIGRMYTGHIVTVEEYYQNGKGIHRVGGPADIKYYLDGTIEREVYYQYGKFYREGGKPTIIRYYRDGNIEMKAYHDDKGYREVWYSEGGEVEHTFNR